MEHRYAFIDTNNMNTIEGNEVKYTGNLSRNDYDRYFQYLIKLSYNTRYIISQLSGTEIKKRIIRFYDPKWKSGILLTYINDKFYYFQPKHKKYKFIYELSLNTCKGYEDDLEIIKGLERKRKIENILNDKN